MGKVFARSMLAGLMAVAVLSGPALHANDAGAVERGAGPSVSERQGARAL